MNPADLFSKDSDPVQLALGETLFKAGEPADAMYVVLEGTLDVIVDGRLVEKSVRGDLIGEMALIDQSPRSGTVVASESAKLAKLDTAQFQRIVQLNPFFATHVMKILVSRIRRNDHDRLNKASA